MRFHPLLLAAPCALGCVSIAPPKQPITDPELALSQQRVQSKRLVSLRAEARVDQRGQSGRIKGSVWMLVERPNHVRFDAMTQFGPAATLTSAGTTFEYSDLRNHRFLHGETCPKNIARFLNIELSVEQTAALLLGEAPVIAQARRDLAWNSEGFYRLRLFAADGARQEIDLKIEPSTRDAPPAGQTLRVARSEIFDPRGKTELRLLYDDYRLLPYRGGQVAMPFTVHVEQPLRGSDTLIHFKHIDFDPELPEGAFSQAVPPGMEEEIASCD